MSEDNEYELIAIMKEISRNISDIAFEMKSQQKELEEIKYQIKKIADQQLQLPTVNIRWLVFFYAKMRYGYVYCFSNAEIDISYYKTCDDGLFWVGIFKWRQEK